MSVPTYKGSALAKARSQVALAYRRKPFDPEAVEAARRNFAEQKISDYVLKVLEGAPPLNDEQCNRLAELLRPTRERRSARHAEAARAAKRKGNKPVSDAA